MAPGFELRTTVDGDTVRLTVSGLLDAYTGGRLREEVAARIDDGARVVELDASAVTFIDSGGLRVLVDTAEDLSERGGGLTLVDPSETVVQVLEITDLRDHFGL